MIVAERIGRSHELARNSKTFLPILLACLVYRMCSI